MKALLALCFAVLSFSAFAAGTSEKAVLQAALQRHVESQLIDGAYRDIDLKTGKTRELYPTKTHPMILTLGDNYILCVTLSDKKGNKSLADYYIASRGDEFVVLRTEIDNRGALERLIKSGAVKKLN